MKPLRNSVVFRARCRTNALRDLKRFREAARICVGMERAKYLQAIYNLECYVSILDKWGIQEGGGQ